MVKQTTHLPSPSMMPRCRNCWQWTRTWTLIQIWCAMVQPVALLPPFERPHLLPLLQLPTVLQRLQSLTRPPVLLHPVSTLMEEGSTQLWRQGLPLHILHRVVLGMTSLSCTAKGFWFRMLRNRTSSWWIACQLGTSLKMLCAQGLLQVQCDLCLPCTFCDFLIVF